jgi:hypothetical protein
MSDRRLGKTVCRDFLLGLKDARLEPERRNHDGYRVGLGERVNKKVIHDKGKKNRHHSLTSLICARTQCCVDNEGVNCSCGTVDISEWVAARPSSGMGKSRTLQSRWNN